MPSADAAAVLNRVLAIVLRSFPQYLRWARPYVPPRHKQVVQTLEKIVAEQDALAERIVDAVIDLGGLPDTGEFPMEFTDTHDLSIDYMLREAVGYARQDLAALEPLAAARQLPPPADVLVADALAMVRRHLQTLEQLPVDPAASTIVRDGKPAYDND